MKPDNELIVHTIPEKEVLVIMVADVHLGAIEHNATKWSQFVKWVQDNPNVYICLGGDLVNNSIRSSMANPFDETMRPAEQKRVMIDHLMPIKERILCAVSGNHEYRSTREADSDITYDIMAKMDIEELYRPNIAYIVLRLGSRTDDQKHARTSWNIVVTHGAGAGMLLGSGINRSDRFMGGIEGADVLLTGHTHKGSVVKTKRLVIDSRNTFIREREQIMVTTTSWMEYGGYAARKMLAPTTTGNPPMVKLGGDHTCKKMQVIW